MSTVTAPRITTCFTVSRTMTGAQLHIFQGGRVVARKSFTSVAAAGRYAEKNGYLPLPITTKKG